MINHNYLVIMAGGIGSRFWPVSRDNRPKQLLDFFGTGRSLLQMTLDRFRPLVPVENVLIVTNVKYKDAILEQIPDLQSEQILCEPCRRNTAPCIAYAIAHIKAKDMNANLIVAPSDHLIMQTANFQQVLRDALDFTSTHDVLLTLGMKPTRPETGYGYIQKVTTSENSESPICKVKTFTEKPNYDLAKVFYESGEFLWNSGIFIWSLTSIRKAFTMHLPEIASKFLEGEKYMGTDQEENFIQDMFPTCPNISIDYGIMEKADNVYVMQADFGWSDLGTWGSLYDISAKDENDNVIVHNQSLLYNAKANIITLESGKLAVIHGLENYIVAESDGVLLICPRDKEQDIRQMVNDAQMKFDGKYN